MQTLALTFVSASRDAITKGDIALAITSINNALCTTDLPIGYRQDAEEIMDLLIRDYFECERKKI